MDKFVHKQMARFCCYILAISVAASPLAHADMMSLVDNNQTHTMETSSHEHDHSHSHAQADEIELPCHHGDAVIPDISIDFGDVACSHDNNLACKVLCSGSSAAISVVFDNHSIARTANSWRTSIHSLALPPLPISLFKPPRA